MVPMGLEEVVTGYQFLMDSRSIRVTRHTGDAGTVFRL
jgi:hypothetical protein